MNSRRRTVQNILWRICAAALLCVAAGASAQTIYKQVDAAGHITFTDRPDTIPLPRTETVAALDVASALASNTAISSRHAAITDANEAARRLKQAQRERERGAKPLFSEQAQGADTSVVDQRRLRRQEKLRHGVEQAQRRLYEARLSHDARR